MQYKTLGNTGLSVSALAFGGAPLMSRAGRTESRRALATAYEAGITLYDTAPLYGQGDSERLIGEFFAGHRSEVVICTKCGQSVPERSLAGTALAFKDAVRPLVKRFRTVKKAAAAFLQSRTVTDDFGADAVERSVDASLKRLNTDYVDVLLLHEPDLETIRRGEAFERLEQLVDRGKIRAFGVSCNTAAEGIEAIERAPRLSVIQVPLNAWRQEPNEVLLPLARQRNVGVIARSPFNKGRRPAARSEESATEAAARESLELIRRGRDLSVAQAALLVPLSYPGVHTVLTSMIDPAHTAENVRAFEALGNGDVPSTPMIRPGGPGIAAGDVARRR